MGCLCLIIRDKDKDKFWKEGKNVATFFVLGAEKVCGRNYHHPSPFPFNQMIFSELGGDGKVTVNGISRFFCSKIPFKRLCMSQIDSSSYHHLGYTVLK